MQSASHPAAFRLIAPPMLLLAGLFLAGLFLASPGSAQGLPVEGDLFADVSAVDGAEMSAVSGQPGTAALPGADSKNNGRDCGSACGADSATSLGTPATQQITYSNSTTVKVTAINNQSSRIGTAIINTAGGLNSAGGGS